MIFAPAFQPIKDVGTGSFVAAEVLARWYDEGRVLTPSSVITSLLGAGGYGDGTVHSGQPSLLLGSVPSSFSECL